MNTAGHRLGTLAIAIFSLTGCPSPTPRPTPPESTVLEVLHRGPAGALEPVAGIPVLRNDPVTGAFVETRTTDAAGRADFGVIAGPVTLSVVRPAPAGGGITRAYTLLGLPTGTTYLRLDRLPGDPGTVYSTVDLALAPALSILQRASACLPSGCQGNAVPGDGAVPAVAITDRDIQDDGRVTLLAEVDDNEMGTAVDCRLSTDLALPANGSIVPGGPGAAPAAGPSLGGFDLDRVVTLRKGVAFADRPSATCAAAFTDADGFSLQGSLFVAGAGLQTADFFDEQQSSWKRGALWIPGPSFAPGSATLSPEDATIAALSYQAGDVQFWLQGTAVQRLVGAHVVVRWSPTGVRPQGPDEREWHLYTGMTVGASSCDGTGADRACVVDVKLPDLAGVGIPPDRVNGTVIEVEAVAPAGITTAAGFWTQVRKQGDAGAVLARGYHAAYRSLRLLKLNFVLDVGPLASPGWLPLGRVTGPGGIDCSLGYQACTATLPGGTSVTLQAIPNAGAEFVEWIGCGNGTSPTAVFDLTRDTSCLPHFRSNPAAPTQPLSVGVISTGNGWITTDDGFISCGWDTTGFSQTSCGPFNYGSGTLLFLHATPTDSLNAYDVVWSGGCSGTTPTISVVMDVPRICQVEFVRRL